MLIKKQNLTNTFIALLLSASPILVSAADTYTMPGATNGNFDFYDAGGTYVVAASHTDVAASLNFTTRTGTLSTSTNFNGYTWTADVTNIYFYDGTIGGSFQTFTYPFTVRSFWTGTQTVTCVASGSLDGCTDEVSAGYMELGTAQSYSYDFNLSEGQFALGLFFDWSSSEDIPVLAVFNIDSIDSNGNITASAIDTGDGADDGVYGGIASDGYLDGDGVPGTKMISCSGCGPFPNQTPVFSGRLIVVNNDSPITAQVAISTNEDTAKTLTSSDFTVSATSFPARVFTSGNKTLTASSGTGYTVSTPPATITPNLNVDTTLTVPVAYSIDVSQSLTTITSVGTTATVTKTKHGYITGDQITIAGANQVEYNGAYTINVPVNQTKAITSLTSSSVTATVTLTSHGYKIGDHVAIAGANEAAYNGTFVVTSVADSNTFTYVLKSAASATPATGSITATLADSNRFTYVFAGSGTTPATGTITATKAHLGAGFDATVSINAQNDAPSISCSYPTSASYTTPYNSTPVASDPDTGDSIASFSLTSDNALPSGITFNTSTGQLSGTSTAGQLGYVTTNIVVSATDTNGPATTSCSAFNLTVTGPNVDPVITSGAPPSSINEDSTYSFTVTASDPGDTVTFSLSGQPGWMSIGSSSGIISGTPVNSDVGGPSGIITITATDSIGATDTQTFTITVLNTNDAPTIGAGTCVSSSLEARSSYNCAPTAGDVDVGDSLTFSATGLPASGNLTIDPTTGAISGTTADADVGTHNITISVTDTGGPATTSLAAYALTINAYNQPPVATGALLTTPADTALNGDLSSLVSDPENCGCLTYRKDPMATSTAHGSVSVSANGTFIYTPESGYNGTDSFDYIATDESNDSNKATVQILVGSVSGENYAGSNFTMFDGSGNNANGGTNDVVASWNGLYNTDESDTTFDHMTLSSITPYFGALWTAHHIRVYGPGTYTFDTTCTLTQIEAGMGGPGQLCNNPLGTGQTEQFLTMTVGTGQVGAHILFDWSVNLNIDVVNVWNVNAQFDVSANPGTGVLYNGAGYGPYPWSGAPAADTVWRLASSDNDGDGIPGIPMVDGRFIGFNANFNLDIISTGSNFTMFDGSGNNANGGTNDVVASWNGLYNTDESDTTFDYMTLSSITPYFGALWTAHHIRVYGPGTYTFDTTCTLTQIEAGMGGPGQLCNNPLGTGQTEQFLTMTVGTGQIGAHILFDWSVNLNIDVVNVWNVNAQFDVSANPGTGVLYNGAGYGPYPWSGAPSADTVWRLASSDNDGDGVPGIPMVDGRFIGFNANFNLMVASGATCDPTPANSYCGTREANTEVPDPDLGAGSAYTLIGLYLMWAGIMFGYRRKH